MHNPHLPPAQSELRNMMVAVFLCVGLLYLWQVMYSEPRRAALEAEAQTQAELEAKLKLPAEVGVAHEGEAGGEGGAWLARKDAVHQGGRLKIETPSLHGSINLKGLRWDDLTLVRHRTELDPESPEVELLSPAASKERYFIQLGWLGSGRVRTPDEQSLWQADAQTLTPAQPVTLRWDNGEGVIFEAVVSVDENYLFSVEQRVINQSGETVHVAPYGLINQNHWQNADQQSAIIHTGPLGVFDETLTELSYEDLKDDKKVAFEHAQGWLGITDKYWLAAFVPAADQSFTGNFIYQEPQGIQRVQVDYRAETQKVESGGRATYATRIFAGAKELGVLEQYRDAHQIPLFDRALDFGVLYFLTKPIFLTLDYFYGLLGNFGLAILLFVVLLKILLFPLSNKSYHAMAQMKELQPAIERIKTQYADDKMRMQQEMMGLWQREKVNPASGCLPILIQIPIFFALYKVLMVTIEMRHAPFYGWIHDLSAADPTNIFTLFGLLAWNPPAFLHIGLWPIIMCATSVVQQRLNPKPADPVQAKVIGFMPYMFLILFASFPAGLLVYWAWNNILSIIQQAMIMRLHERKHGKKKKADA